MRIILWFVHPNRILGTGDLLCTFAIELDTCVGFPHNCLLIAPGLERLRSTIY